MATLVLTTLGTALGGPIGGALGSIVGQTIDRNLFGPSARRGPRLGDLSVQTSSYGTPIPRIYGKMRVAGTVVWAAELREEEIMSGGGKGAAGAIAYAYSASFAVALSSRTAQSIGRIWADGKLLRGADGNFKTKVKHRFYPGSEAQPVDPLIASTEGTDGSPAFRGMALAVFEDLLLADYGNRIPSLTFELIADIDQPRVAAVMSDISRGVMEQGEEPATLLGFAAMGNDRRAAIETLVDLWGGTYRDDGTMLRCVSGPQAVETIGEATSAGCVVEGDARVARVEREQEAADALPSALTLEYYDPARDYQAGQMRAVMPSGGRSQKRIDSAAALDASMAKSLASDALARRWAGRDRVMLRLAPSFIAMRPGQVVAIVGMAGRYRIEAVTLDGLVAVIEARRIPIGRASLIADHGRGNLAPDLTFGRSVPLLLDLPASGTATANSLGLALAVGSDGPFKPTAVTVEANGQPLTSLRVNRAAITGVAMTVLGPGSRNLLDQINSVEIQLSNPLALLYHADQAALAMGANSLAIGNELIQFGRATARGGARYRLSQLLRGRRGSEWAIDGHVGSESIVLLDAAAIVDVNLDPAMVGVQIRVRAFGVADDDADPPTYVRVASGENLRPLSPCHLSAILGEQFLDLNWVSRLAASGWAEESGNAAFDVTVRRGSGVIKRVTYAPTLALPTADVLALGSGSIEIEVIQKGVVASRPATLRLNA